MARYLKQVPGGHIYVATSVLEQRDDMVPCDPPGTTPAAPEQDEGTELMDNPHGPDQDLEGQEDGQDSEGQGSEDEDQDPEEDPDGYTLEELQDLYRDHFGKSPHSAMKRETLLEKLGL